MIKGGGAARSQGARDSAELWEHCCEPASAELKSLLHLLITMELLLSTVPRTKLDHPSQKVIVQDAYKMHGAEGRKGVSLVASPQQEVQRLPFS